MRRDYASRLRKYLKILDTYEAGFDRDVQELIANLSGVPNPEFDEAIRLARSRHTQTVRQAKADIYKIFPELRRR